MLLTMFKALRQFTVPMTMIGGTILATIDDLSFSISGYSYVMMSNLLTAAYCHRGNYHTGYWQIWNYVYMTVRC